MTVQLEGLENLVPEDGFSVVIGTFTQGSSQLVLSSLPLDEDCYFVDEGGYNVQLQQQDLGGGELSVLLYLEETQCAVVDTSSRTLLPLSIIVVQ